MRRIRHVLTLCQRASLTAYEAQQGRFALWAPVLMGAGVMTYFSLRAEPPAWLGGAVAAPSLLGVLLGRQWLWARFVFGGLLAVAVGFTAIQCATMRAPPPETALPPQAVWITGRIAVIEPLPEGRRLTLERVRVQEPALDMRRLIRVRLKTADAQALGTGDTVRLRAMIRPIPPPAYPGGWDQQRDAFFGGLGGQGYALGPVERLSESVPGAPFQAVQRLREALAARIQAAIPGAAGAVAVGVLLGIQSGIPPPDLAAFRDSGLAHILSVSGLHMAIVMGCAMAGARFLFALSEYASLHWPTRNLAAIAALAAGGFYTVLTGNQVPMLRCLFMAAILTLALLAGRRPFSLRGLAMAAMAIILIAPQEVAGVSLQMSFSAVLALIAGFDALRPWLARVVTAGLAARAGAYLLGLALTSALAGTASMPFGIYHFGKIQLYFVLSNMIAVPLTSVLVMPFAMLALPMMLVGAEGVPLVPVQWGIEATLWIARVTASLPAATLDVRPLPDWGLVVLTLGLAWLGLWRGRIRLAGVGAILLGLASPALHRPPDILVSADARLIAVRTPSGIFLQQTQGGTAFTRDAWLHLWADGPARPIPASGQHAGAAIECAGQACLLRPRPDARAALLVRGGTRIDGCAEAVVIVSAEPARGLCPRPWPKLVDRFTVWRDGAAAIWLDTDDARIVTDRMARGARPWVPPVPTPRQRPPANLTPAPTEGG